MNDDDIPINCAGCGRRLNLRLVGRARALLVQLLATAPAAVPALTVMHGCHHVNVFTLGDLRRLAEGHNVEPVDHG